MSLVSVVIWSSSRLTICRPRWLLLRLYHCHCHQNWYSLANLKCTNTQLQFTHTNIFIRVDNSPDEDIILLDGGGEPGLQKTQFTHTNILLLLFLFFCFFKGTCRGFCFVFSPFQFTFKYLYKGGLLNIYGGMENFSLVMSCQLGWKKYPTPASLHL